MIATEIMRMAFVFEPSKVKSIVSEVREIEEGGIEGNETIYAIGRVLIHAVCSGIVTRKALGAYRWKDSKRIVFQPRVESDANVYRFASMKNLSLAVLSLYKALSSPIDSIASDNHSVKVGLTVREILIARAALCLVNGGKRLKEQDIDDGCLRDLLEWENKAKRMVHYEDKIAVVLRRRKLRVRYVSNGLVYVVLIYPSGLSEVYLGMEGKGAY